MSEVNRMLRAAVAALALAGLAGCADLAVAPEALEHENIVRETSRAFADTYLHIPFADGAVSVIATEGGKLRTYRLVPCRNGTAICAGSERGRVGALRVSPDYHIVTGLYGRVFFLSPGGDGWLRRGQSDLPLAWDSEDRARPQPLYTFPSVARN
jgi:hypothetical protein